MRAEIKRLSNLSWHATGFYRQRWTKIIIRKDRAICHKRGERSALQAFCYLTFSHHLPERRLLYSRGGVTGICTALDLRTYSTTDRNSGWRAIMRCKVRRWIERCSAVRDMFEPQLKKTCRMCSARTSSGGCRSWSCVEVFLHFFPVAETQFRHGIIQMIEFAEPICALEVPCDQNMMSLTDQASNQRHVGGHLGIRNQDS